MQVLYSVMSYCNSVLMTCKNRPQYDL